MNRTLPMASSSEARILLTPDHVLAPGRSPASLTSTGTYLGEEWAGEWQLGRSASNVISASLCQGMPYKLRRIGRDNPASKSVRCTSTYLEHVQEGCLSGVVETEEKELGVLIEQTE